MRIARTFKTQRGSSKRLSGDVLPRKVVWRKAVVRKHNVITLPLKRVGNRRIYLIGSMKKSIFVRFNLDLNRLHSPC